MTDSKEPRSGVLEAMARAIFDTAIGANHWESPWYADERAGCHYSARAALTAVLDHMQEPSEAMRVAGADGVKFWLGDDRWDEMVKGDLDEWPGVPPAMTGAWQAMLSQYRKEALGDD